MATATMEPTTATSIAGVINATSSSFLSSSSAMSLSERSYLLAGCRANCRVDGRTCASYRPYILQIDAASQQQQQQQQQQRKGGGDPGLLPLCHGSARLMGSTGHASHETQHLLCTVKADLVRPLQQQPNHGMVELHVHFSGATAAAAASSNQSRRDSEQEVQAILSQLLLNNNDTTTTGGGSWLVDTRALCLQPGTLAWRLAVDVYILEAAGGCLIDCAAQLICATLLQATWLPNVAVVSNNSAATTKGSDNTNKHGDDRITSDTIGDGGNPTSTSLSPISFTVDGDWAKAKLVPGLPCNSSVMIVTVAVLLDYEIVVSTTTHHSQRPPVYSLLVDPNAQEEACAMTLVHVALQVAEVGTTIVGLSKTQSGALPMNLLPEITKTAVQAVSAAQRAFVVQQPLQLAAVPASSHQHERCFTNTSNANHHPSTLLQEQFEWRIPSLD